MTSLIVTHFGFIALTSILTFISITSADISYLDLASDAAEAQRRIHRDFTGVQKATLIENLGKVETNLKDLHTQTRTGVQNMAAKTKVRDMMVSVNAAIPKMTSGDTALVLSGVADLVTGLGMYAGPPVGLIFSVFGGLLSAMFRMFSDTDVENDLSRLIENAVGEGFDKDLLGWMNGVKSKFKESKRRLDYYNSKERYKTMSEPTLQSLINYVGNTETVQMGRFEQRIREGARTAEEASRLIKIIRFYTELIQLRNALLADLKILIGKSKKAKLRECEVEGSRVAYNQTYRRTLEFLRLQGCYKSDVSECDWKKFYHIYNAYYPINRNENSKQIDKALNAIGLPEFDIPFPGIGKVNRITPVAYPTWDICAPSGIGQQNFEDPLPPMPCEEEHYYRWILSPSGEDGYFYIRNTNPIHKLAEKNKILKLSYSEIPEGQFSLIPADRNGRFLIGVKSAPGHFLQMDWWKLKFSSQPDDWEESTWVFK